MLFNYKSIMDGKHETIWNQQQRQKSALRLPDTHNLNLKAAMDNETTNGEVAAIVHGRIAGDDSENLLLWKKWKPFSGRKKIWWWNLSICVWLPAIKKAKTNFSDGQGEIGVWNADFCFSRSLVRDRVYSLFLISFDNRKVVWNSNDRAWEHALFLWAACPHWENIELGNRCGVPRRVVLSVEWFYLFCWKYWMDYKKAVWNISDGL